MGDVAELLGGMTSRDWVARLAATPDDPEAIFDTKTLGSRGWLLDLISVFGVRRRLRAVLLAFPDAAVVLDATWKVPVACLIGQSSGVSGGHQRTARHPL